ncbi:MAG: ribonuclease D [Alphaproteobacteria bacterium]|nr:ribonuclease D [Alphaproteobacteria bacterium]
MTNITVIKGDLPAHLQWPKMIAVDTETTGLDVVHDRLCLVQIGDGKGNMWLVQILPGKKYPNLKKLLTNPKILKIFHFARFDVAKLKVDLHIDVTPVYCTKIAHKLVWPDKKHSLKNLCEDMLGVVLDKEQQCSDWTRKELSEEQIRYAANDVTYLHALKALLDKELKKKKRANLAAECFRFVNTRAELDILGYEEPDLFHH